MVGRLKHYSRDPQAGKHRGAGMYWKRKDGIYSKYNRNRDAKIHSKHHYPSKAYRHTGDKDLRTNL